MRPFRTAFFILGFFQSLVIQAEPFGTTGMMVYDTDFLSVPEGPAAEGPEEPALPLWVVLTPEVDLPPGVILSIPPPELPS